jgi:cell division protein FtsB
MRVSELRRGVTIGILLLVAFWLGSLIWGLAGKASIAIREAADVKRQYTALEKRKAALSASIAALDTAHGKDAAIRTSFGVARPGEEVIVVVPPATTTPPAAPSWWQQIVSWFRF